jgi:sugar diacid utilization regulator
MVNSTNEFEATHDCFGTDLGRVRQMLAAGYGESMIGQCLGITTNRARNAIIVATDDRQGAPTPEEIAAECEAIQSGWTEEQAHAAIHGRDRHSSKSVPQMEQSEEQREHNYWSSILDRIERKEPRVYRTNNGRFICRVQLKNAKAGRRFDTREEAVAWGREWLRDQAKRQAGVCCR